MNDLVKIDKGIPIPATPKASRWPFAAMQVGDSFLATENLRTALWMYSKKYDMKFSSRREGDGIRVWRVA